jgi:hypothetical protein
VQVMKMCAQCGKVRYATRVAARRQAHGRLRARRCPAGYGWHLLADRSRRRRRPYRRDARDSRPVVHRLMAGGRIGCR